MFVITLILLKRGFLKYLLRNTIYKYCSSEDIKKKLFSMQRLPRSQNLFQLILLFILKLKFPKRKSIANYLDVIEISNNN